VRRVENVFELLASKVNQPQLGLGMQRPNGDLIPWLVELQTQVRQASAKGLGLRLPPGGYEVFKRHLQEDKNAKRLLRDVLPRCQAELLAHFIALVAGHAVEDKLIQLTRKRGSRLKKILRVRLLGRIRRFEKL
jgi:hypothetical protein